MATVPKRTRIPYTYREYALLPNDGRRYEVVDGELLVSPAPTPFHQTVSRRLMFRLMEQLEEAGIAYVFNAPIDVILGDTTIVQPDLAILRVARKELISKRGIEGPPDVVVEILSPSTRGTDRYLKGASYASHGIPEYWIVDPELGHVELYRIEGDRYGIHTRFDRASPLASPELPEVAIPLAPIFRPH